MEDPTMNNPHPSDEYSDSAISSSDHSPLHFSTRIEIDKVSDKFTQVRNEIARVIVGQKDMVDLILVALLSGGHVLLEGVPGVAKTITARLLAKTMDTSFSRIQFTPDLMPSDILGTLVFDAKKSDFEYKKGPVFTHILLIDEINRAPAKTQAALFEVMEERQVTMDGITYPMSEPFIVLATQNPIEQEGTYRLPEAQLDRFLMKIEIGYPELEDEIEILHREQRLKTIDKLAEIQKVLTGDEITAFRNIVADIAVDDSIIQYIARIIVQTRQSSMLYLGASPRASIALLKTSRSLAALKGRDFVTPEDIKQMAYPVIGHRVVVAPEKEMEGLTAEMIIKQIVDSIEIPR